VVAGYIPDAGHIVKLDFEPHLGHEQGGWRPALVLSPAGYNGKSGLAVVVPITNQSKGYPFEVPLPAGKLRSTGVILADALRNVDWRQRRARFVEQATPDTLKAVKNLIALLLGMSSN
jgi:mRNA interferase MazF